ncbi:hypothetical protein GQ44DRAFT_775732 [Phaeosphaeriaceae sp. PMI808]|nr:hypothetical protein GQ44DRAFT_775732 [Phaeosphaeriaceae sp. PMI808]
MAGPAQFHSSMEAEAYTWLRKHIKPPPSNELPILSNDPIFDIEKLRTIPLFPSNSTGWAIEPPFFKDSSAPSQIKSSFTLAHVKGESIKFNVSPSPKREVLEREQDDDPTLALADMEYQFNKWTHYRREGVTSIPFVMANAPPHLHASIAAWQDSPTSHPAPPSSEPDTQAQQPKHPLIHNSDTLNGTQLIHSEQALYQSSHNVSATAPSLLADDNTSATTHPESTQDQNTGLSKRAAMIAKQRSKATTSTTDVLRAPGPSQKHIVHKNRHRKPRADSKGETSSSKVEAPSPNAVATSETRQKRIVIKYDDDEEGHMKALQLAVQEGAIDPKDDGQVNGLMDFFETGRARGAERVQGTVVEEVLDGQEGGEK